MPFFEKAKLFPAEDSQDLKNNFGTGNCVISVLKLPRIANFDDFQGLATLSSDRVSETPASTRI